jgi:uncharacterized sporulation protein YeaH/YhbH (DUF444 family)
MKNIWVHSCCGKKSGECQGCVGNMQLVKKSEYKKRKEPTKMSEVFEDKLLQSTLRKIDEGIVTRNDFNLLISETTPESIRDRIRRRTIVNPESKHVNKDGHQKLKLPEFNKRVMPKRKPVNQQNHGRSRVAHRHSSKTQAKQYSEEISFIKNNIGKPLTECDYSKCKQDDLSRVVSKMMTIPNINRDWLQELQGILENGR